MRFRSEVEDEGCQLQEHFSFLLALVIKEGLEVFIELFNWIHFKIFLLPTSPFSSAAVKTKLLQLECTDQIDGAHGGQAAGQHDECRREESL